MLYRIEQHAKDRIDSWSAVEQLIKSKQKDESENFHYRRKIFHVICL